MKKLIIPVAVALSLSACGGGSDSTMEPTDTLETTNEPVAGAALPAAVDTETLEVEQDFAFNTARSIEIAFDIEEARGTQAAVSICTEYTDLNPYEVDYSSCPVKAIMSNGEFNHSMEVTNAYDSVIAVVWFQGSDMEPLAREFFVEQQATARSKHSSGVQTIVWN